MQKILLVILACFLFKYLITPTDVILCMGPYDYIDVYAQNNPISKAQMVSDPSTYWQNNPVDNDAYAQHQRVLAQNSVQPPHSSSPVLSIISYDSSVPTPRSSISQSPFPDYQVSRSNSHLNNPTSAAQDFYSIFWSNNQPCVDMPQFSQYISSNGLGSKPYVTSNVYELHSKPISELAGEPVPQKFSSKNVRFELAGDCTFSSFSESSGLKRSNFGTLKTVSTDIGEINDVIDTTISVTNEWMLPHFTVKGTGMSFFKGVELSKQCYYLICKLGKRKLMWKLWEKDRGIYKDYDTFKYDWNFNESFWGKIERDIRKDIKCNLRDFVGYNEMKRELKKSVKREVEKELRKKRPFRK